jgi:LacI family transcriptional regulator
MLPPPFSDMVSLIEALDQARVPFVRIAPTMMADPGRSVFAFEREAAVAMMQYLVGLGHRRIAFISIHGPAQSSYMGYCDGLRDSALPHDQTRVAACDGSISSAIASARTLLDVPVHERPTAIFSASDLVAAGALRAARELGIEVPTQLSIAGFGNDPIATQVWPQLTTSRLPVSTLAELAAKTLLAQLHSLPGPHRTILEPVLLTRRSTAAPFHHAP